MQPCNVLVHVHSTCLSCGISSKFLQYDHTMKNIGQSMFHHHVGACVWTCNCVLIWTIWSCGIPRFPHLLLLYKPFFSTCGSALPSNRYIVSVSESSCQSTNTLMKAHMTKAASICISAFIIVAQHMLQCKECLPHCYEKIRHAAISRSAISVMK